MPIQRFLQRLVWACVLPVFLLAGALAFVGLQHRYADDLEASEHASANLMRRIDAHVQARLESLEVLARTYSGTDAAALASHFREAQAFQAVFGSHVILADAQRHMLYNTRAPLGTALPELPRPQGPSAVQSALVSGRPAVGDLVFGPVAREALLPIVVPVVRDGQPVALLLSTLETRELQALLDRAQLPSFLGLSLLDGNGDPIATRRPGTPAATGLAGTASPGAPIAPTAPASTASTPATSPPSDAPGRGQQGEAALRSDLGTWSLAMTLDRPALAADLVRTGLLLAVALATTSAGVAWAAHRAGLRLARAGTSLAAEPAEAGGSPQGGVADILEVSLARQRLQTLAAERERANAEARDSDRQLRHLLGALREAVWISTDHHIAFANPAAEHLVGVPSGHMSGRSIFDFMQPESAERARPLLQRVRAGESEVLFESMRFVDPDAPPRTLLVTGVTQALPDGQATLTIARDVSELRVTRDALERSNRELVRLVERLNTAEEEERRRIARELHDDLQQRLGVIVMEQQQAARALPEPAAASAAALARAQAMAAGAIDSVRRIVRSLRPQALDELGVAAAIEQLVREGSERAGLQAEFEAIGPEGADAALPPAVGSCLYRVAQESLTNVRKHARASFVHVVLDLSRPGSIVLQVTDDGRGLAAAGPPDSRSLGIRGMRERVQALGGQLVVEEPPGGGTRVQATLPWPLT